MLPEEREASKIYLPPRCVSLVETRLLGAPAWPPWKGNETTILWLQGPCCDSGTAGDGRAEARGRSY